MDPRVKTAVFLAMLTALLLAIGHLLGGYEGLIIAGVIAVGMNFFSYYFSDKFVLKAYKAKEVTKRDNPLLFSLVQELVMREQMPMPKLYVIPSHNPNAFATGRNPKHSAVAVTTGIMEILSKNELKGVLAHELSHIKNRDILIASIAGMIAGIISYVAFIARFSAIFGFGGRDGDNNIVELLVLAIVTPIIALLLQMAISRSREYLADRSGAKMMGSGHALADALEKLEAGSHRRPMKMGNNGTAHLFIVNPFRANAIMELFSTHPSIPSRVKKLRTQIV